jgi:hypothetical protein
LGKRPGRCQEAVTGYESVDPGTQQIPFT